MSERCCGSSGGLDSTPSTGSVIQRLRKCALIVGGFLPYLRPLNDAAATKHALTVSHSRLQKETTYSYNQNLSIDIYQCSSIAYEL